MPFRFSVKVRNQQQVLAYLERVKRGAKGVVARAAGEYIIGADLRPEVSAPAGTTTTQRASASVSARVSLFPIGTVRSHGGTGTRFVAFGHRNCSYDRVPVRIGRSAPRWVKKITFSVNGQRRFTLSGRELRRTSVKGYARLQPWALRRTEPS